MWISHVPYPEATGRLKDLYDRVKGPGDNVDNIMLAHSLRPHSMEGHMALYKYVLHHSANQVPKWFLEALGVYVSMLNGCAYCVDHHFTGLSRLVNDPARAAAIYTALKSGSLESAFTDAEIAAIHYAKALTRAPQVQDTVKARLDDMRKTGLDDGRILEINQVVSYFSYANRTVLGLGVTTDGDILGLSPNNSENQDDWNHR